MFLFWFFVLIISLFVLVKSAEYFVNAAEKIGLILGVSPFFIGMTVVALGTSLPELFTSIIAVLNNSSEIVLGNVVGSNIANILLIVGITAITVKKIKVDYDIINLDLPLFAASTAGLIAMVAWDKEINIFEGIIAISFFAIYFFYLYKSRHDTIGEEIKKKLDETKEKLIPKKINPTLILILIASALFLFLGAKFTVSSVLELSALIGITTSAIALSAVAIGTSLPELAVTIRAVKNGNGDLAIGNIFGSNLFNGSLVVGLSSLLGPLKATNDILYIAIPFLAVATILYVFSGISRKIHNYEGAMFLLIYVLFLAKLFNIF
ncbi:MAG: calcium/sodium antiporter [Patescibacteria group bacterium]|nr:calcium/sodium antiporter [Patescibacteria group bacterium]